MAELASAFRAINNEANFPAPIEDELVGGTHIAFELITKKGNRFFMTVWPKGLPRHDDPQPSIRFPHGLIQWGETVEQCAHRLVKAQLGMSTESVKVVDIDSYVDEKDHWHIEPICLVEVTGTPEVAPEASEVIEFTLDDPPNMTFWDQQEFIETVSDHL